MEVIPVDYRITIGVVVCCSDVTPTGSFSIGRPRQNTLLSGVSDSFFSNASQGRHFTLRLFRSRAGPFFLERKDNESEFVFLMFASSSTIKYPDIKVEEYRKLDP